MSEFQPFDLERLMSRFEQDVKYNLSESGVYPVFLRELLEIDPTGLDRMLSTDLNYPHVNGLPELRANIAALYDGASSDNVLVTVGAIEANYITTITLLSPGDEIILMAPNYLQIWGIARNHGYQIKTFRLVEMSEWAPDLEHLNELVTAETRVIAICNPNNPTGYILTEPEMDAIVAAAERVGAWILADEVYRGAERTTDQETPSFYGRYEKVIATGSMSKAYGMPGLRIGWLVGPEDMVAEIWARHEYVAISAAMLSNKLAALALSPEVRPQLLQRTRDYIRRGFPILEAWMSAHQDSFRMSPPQAAAMAFVRYDLDINSTALVDRLIKEKSVLIVPGDHFGMDKFLRVSFGLPRDYLIPALDRIHELVKTL